MKKIKLLVDLKPALDGYAGIPQESRLLFVSFRHLSETFDVEGLLQHGSGFLTSENAGDESQPPHDKVIKDSRTVVSFCRNAAKIYIPGLPKSWQRYIALQELRWYSFRKRTVKMGVFETNMFDDFIWRHLFSKSIKVADKILATASRFRIISPSRKNFHNVGLKSFSRFVKPRYLDLETTGYDFLLAQTPFPARVSKTTKLVVRYHDAIPVFMPHTIGDKSFHQTSHYKALKENVRAGALFACVSKATKSDLLKMFPEAEPRTTVIHNIVSDDFFPGDEPKRLVRSIIVNRSAGDDKIPMDAAIIAMGESDNDKPMADYLLMVSTLEPRKNHQLLISAWERLKYSGMPDLKLVLVGGTGWDYEPILDFMRPWMQRGELFHLTNVPTDELRVLYRHAAATICPSLAEGFDYSGVEAMRCGGIVVSSDIAVHQEVYGDGSAYFDPYSVEDAVRNISRVLGQDAEKEREALLQASKAIAKRYTAESILPRWQEFLTARSNAAIY